MHTESKITWMFGNVLYSAVLTILLIIKWIPTTSPEQKRIPEQTSMCAGSFALKIKKTSRRVLLVLQFVHWHLTLNIQNCFSCTNVLNI